jgi:trigger factor
MSSDSVTIERQKKGRIVATVRFEEAQYATAESEALSVFAKHINLPGFRPGNAPLDMVRQKVKPDDLFEESIRILLRTSLPAIVEEHKIMPVIPPKVEVQSKMPVTLQVTFIEKPEVTVKKPDDLTVPKKEVKVEQKDMDRVIRSVLQEQKKTTVVERAAKEGDQLTVDFHAKDEQGNEISGLHAHGYAIELGSNTLLPGFEEKLIGVNAGETKNFTLTMPEKFPVPELAGKKATFDVKVEKVEEVSLPELTDAFAKEHLQAESADAFKEMVRQSIAAQEEQFSRMDREKQLMDLIRERTTVDIADELLDEEVRAMVEDWSAQLERQGKTIAQALEEQKRTPEQAEKDLRLQATDRWKLRLGIAKLIELKEITISPEELENAFKAFIERLPQDQRDNATAQWQSRAGLFDEIRWRSMVDKLIEGLLA